MSRAARDIRRRKRSPWPYVVTGMVLIAGAWYCWVGEFAVAMNYEAFVSVPVGLLFERIVRTTGWYFTAGIFFELMSWLACAEAIPLRRLEPFVGRVVQGSILWTLGNLSAVLLSGPVLVALDHYLKK